MGSEWERGFEAGTIHAASVVCSLRDEPVIAGDILREGGIDLKDWTLEDYDKEIFKKAGLL